MHSLNYRQGSYTNLYVSELVMSTYWYITVDLPRRFSIHDSIKPHHCENVLFIGLSFERPCLMEGLKLMIAKSAKSAETVRI